MESLLFVLKVQEDSDYLTVRCLTENLAYEYKKMSEMRIHSKTAESKSSDILKQSICKF